MKRILAFVLSMAMVLSMCFIAGCGNETPDTTTENTPVQTTTEPTQSTPAETTGTEETTTAANETPEETTSDIEEPIDLMESWDGYTRLPGFDNVNFRGKTFVIAGDLGTADSWPCVREIYSDDTDSIAVAVRERNQAIEKLYNCTIELDASDSPAAKALAEVTSGTHTIDLYTYKYGISNSATNGSNYNLYTLGIDFSNPWWDQQFVKTYTVKNNVGVNTLYSIVGDFSLTSYHATYGLMFNKTVYETNIKQKLGYDIYQLVRDGKWTMDVFIEMIKAAGTDNSGNSEYHYDEGDILGWLRTNHATHALHTASGMPIISTNNGVLSFAIENSATQWSTVVEKAIEVWKVEQGETISYSKLREALISGNTLFGSNVIFELEGMKEADVSIGLVPYPKFSETQENYAHYVDNHVMAYQVPTSVSELTEIGQFFEIYAAHSRAIVRPAWIDAYAYEYCGDADSAEMLNIVLDSRTYDPGYLCFNLEGEISQMISEGKNNITQWVGRRSNAVIGAGGYLETFVNGISDNEA